MAYGYQPRTTSFGAGCLPTLLLTVWMLLSMAVLAFMVLAFTAPTPGG